MCGIKNDNINMSIVESGDTIHHVGSDTNSSTAEQTALGILSGVGILNLLLDILDGDKTAETTFFINDGELLFTSSAENVLSFLESDANRSGNKILRSHAFADLLGVIGLELEVTVGDDTNELPLVINDGNTGDTELTHQIVCVLKSVVRGKIERISNDTILGTLYLVDFISLCLDGHILVDNTDTTLTCHSDCHAMFSYGIHSCGHHRDVQFDAVREVRGEIYHIGGNLRVLRNQQNVVKSNAFTNYL